MIPQVAWAFQNNIGVIILNPNFSFDDEKKEVNPEVSGGLKHVDYAWKEYVMQTQGNVFVVAHSAAGYSMGFVIKNYFEFCQTNVKMIAFTDAIVDGIDLTTKEYEQWASETCVSYDASSKPLGTKLKP